VRWGDCDNANCGRLYDECFREDCPERQADPMRVLICGSRSWSDVHVIAAIMANLPDGTVVIHGGAQGADMIANDIAETMGLQIMEFKITKKDWKQYGKGAGPMRNSMMLGQGNPDSVIAFRMPGHSPGTDDMIRQAEAAGVPVQIVSAPVNDVP
jgi:hypothetical protein